MQLTNEEISIIKHTLGSPNEAYCSELKEVDSLVKKRYMEFFTKLNYVPEPYWKVTKKGKEAYSKILTNTEDCDIKPKIDFSEKDINSIERLGKWCIKNGRKEPEYIVSKKPNGYICYCNIEGFSSEFGVSTDNKEEAIINATIRMLDMLKAD